MQFDPREDGITHINIYSRANTSLGKALSNWTPCTIKTSIGEFRSIEGLIFFMGSFDDRLRKAVGFEAKQLGEKLDRGIRLPDDIFKKIIIEGMKSKLIYLDKKLFEEFFMSKLPLTHYYRYDTKVIEIPKWQWQVEEWEKIRREVIHP
jgi:hypothetical protein